MTATAVACIRKGNLTTWSNCVCPPCTRTRNRLSKLSRNQRFNRIPSDQGMVVLERLVASGMTATAIADAVGISRNTASNWLAKIRTGRSFKLGPEACRRLVNAKTPTDGFVGTTVPRRMLQALGRIGWSCDELNRRIRSRGRTLGDTTLHSIRTDKTLRVHAWLANDITELYEALQGTPGQSAQTIRVAIAYNWAPPLAWEDNAISDPNAAPVGLVVGREPAGYDQSRVERRVNGDRTVRLHKGESEEVVRRLLAAGASTLTISRDYGIKAERYVHVGPRRRVAA